MRDEYRAQPIGPLSELAHPIDAFRLQAPGPLQAGAASLASRQILSELIVRAGRHLGRQRARPQSSKLRVGQLGASFVHVHSLVTFARPVSNRAISHHLPRSSAPDVEETQDAPAVANSQSELSFVAGRGAHKGARSFARSPPLTESPKPV